MSTSAYAPLAGLLAAMVLLSGCEKTDPYRREGMWRPEGVVNANIAAQLVNPRDLQRGRGDTSPVYRQSAAAVTKLWAGGPAAGGASPASPFGIIAAGGAGGGAGGGGAAPGGDAGGAPK